ncbi:MAG: Abi family protein [Bacilli bacterium]|nr:Abi family protein [Bacilli bacterium]
MASSKTKIFKTIDEQITILRHKGLTIDDPEKTKNILLRENYFFISGYRHLFTSQKDKFLEGTTFEELYATFIFDRKLRNIFFKNILIVENNIKSIISYQLSKKYGFRDKDYLNPQNFQEDKLASRQVKDVLNKVKRQVSVNGRQHTATMHYIDNYGYIPMWVLVKVLSFGIMSEFYGILRQDDQQNIASFYKLEAPILEKYLSIISNFRNVCAHEDILYDHRTQKIIPDSKYHEQLNIPKIDEVYKYGKNDLFGLVIMLKSLLSAEEFSEMMDEIRLEVEILDDIVSVIPLSKILQKIGFPDNWYELESLE